VCAVRQAAASGSIGSSILYHWVGRMLLA
jgi:hypothetical protein